MSKCAVVGCKSVYNPFNGTHGTSFHRITRNKKYLPLWEQAIRFRPDSDPDHAKICNLHFKLGDFVEGKDKKRVLKPTAVPSLNCMEDDSGDDEDDSDDEEVDSDNEEDDENLSILKKALLASNSSFTNNGAKVIPCCNSAQPPNSQNTKKTSNFGVQTKMKTDREISLLAKVKFLQQRLRRREAKISYMKTVLNMIKKHTKGTDVAYKLCCELQNISESELDKSNSKDNLKISQSPVNENEGEDSSADEMGSFVEVVHSPNLKPCNISFT